MAAIFSINCYTVCNSGLCDSVKMLILILFTCLVTNINVIKCIGELNLHLNASGFEYNINLKCKIHYN